LRIPQGTRQVTALLVVAGLALLLTTTSASAFQPKCSSHFALKKHGIVGFRFRCNYEIDQLGAQINPSVSKFPKRLVLVQPHSEDVPFQCARRSRSRFGCGGSASTRVAITGRFRPSGDPCESGSTFQLFGGVDCNPPPPSGFACPAIGYRFTAEDRQPSGCG
jgi:hypothetical protein